MIARPRIVCLVGPTASGKSALALELAERLGGEIVSADSRQVYRRLEVGTAKPTPAERARVPHHCLDLVEPWEAFDASRFRLAAAAAVADVVRRGRVPLVVGGTGLYLRALLSGLCPVPPRRPALRRVLARTPDLHRWLAVLDPEAARRIHPNDAVRTVRGVEVALATGVPLSRWQATHGFGDAPYDALVLGLERPAPELDARIAARARAMLDAGFLDEVRALHAAGVGAAAPGFCAVGYRELLACVEGHTDVEAALAATVRATRRFAKRQRTWFRHQLEVAWRHPERERARIAAEVEAFVGGEDPAAREIAKPPPPR